MEPVEAAAIGNELGSLLLEHLPDRLVGPLGMAVRLGPGDAFVHEPGVQLVVALEPQPRRNGSLLPVAAVRPECPVLFGSGARQDSNLASAFGGGGLRSALEQTPHRQLRREHPATGKASRTLDRNLSDAENTAQYPTQLTTIRFLSVSPLKRFRLPMGLPITRSY